VRIALVAIVIAGSACACGAAKPAAPGVAPPAPHTSPAAPAAPPEPAQAILEVRAGEPSDTLHLVVPSAHVEQRLLFFGHEFDCVVAPARSRTSWSVACDPREGPMTIVVEGPKLVVRKGSGKSSPSIAEMAVGGPIVLDPTIRRAAASPCASASSMHPTVLGLGIARGDENMRVVQLRGALAKPLTVGKTVTEGLRCRGWIGRTGDKGAYICDAPDLRQEWTLAVDDGRLGIIEHYGDADGTGSEAVGALRAACGKRFALGTATPHKDRDWAPMGSPRCDSPCWDAKDDCEQTCNVNLDVAAGEECRDKCTKPHDACMQKRCNPK